MRRMFKVTALSRKYVLSGDRKTTKKNQRPFRISYRGPSKRYSITRMYVGIFFKKMKKIRAYRKFCKLLAV